mmetsp:Transcript_565/g.889  ORF Transcript_565/g.889 Transcript_565/m.889 type:complete len:255 (-) Transcript_565:2573-3337(-)
MIAMCIAINKGDDSDNVDCSGFIMINQNNTSGTDKIIAETTAYNDRRSKTIILAAGPLSMTAVVTAEASFRGCIILHRSKVLSTALVRESKSSLVALDAPMLDTADESADEYGGASSSFITAVDTLAFLSLRSKDLVALLFSKPGRSATRINAANKDVFTTILSGFSATLFHSLRINVVKVFQSGLNALSRNSVHIAFNSKGDELHPSKVKMFSIASKNACIIGFTTATNITNIVDKTAKINVCNRTRSTVLHT